MKNAIRGIIFWTIVMTFVSIMFAVGQALINVITINFIKRLFNDLGSFLFFLFTFLSLLCFIKSTFLYYEFFTSLLGIMLLIKIPIPIIKNAKIVIEPKTGINCINL